MHRFCVLTIVNVLLPHPVPGEWWSQYLNRAGQLQNLCSLPLHPTYAALQRIFLLPNITEEHVILLSPPVFVGLSVL